VVRIPPVTQGAEICRIGVEEDVFTQGAEICRIGVEEDVLCNVLRQRISTFIQPLSPAGFDA